MDGIGDGVALAQEFGLGQVLDLVRLSEGNAPAYRLRTNQGVFFVKWGRGQAGQWAELYRVVERRLNAQGVRQARMLCTKQGQPISGQGYSVFEWLDGEAVRVPDDQQFSAHAAYLARYHQGLKLVPLDEPTIDWLTRPADLWRKAASLQYMLDVFVLDGPSLGLSEQVTSTAERALGVLRLCRQMLERLPRQLIHTDVGPGNILFERDRVVSIIDFTPGYEPALYGLCVSLFWHCVFDQPQKIARARITKATEQYARGQELDDEARACFFALMVRAAAFRLFSRLLARQEAGQPAEAAPFSPGSTQRMAECVQRVLAWEGFLTGCFPI